MFFATTSDWIRLGLRARAISEASTGIAQFSHTEPGEFAGA
jgi:hypothetical protein